ncbi:MAG: hypothetical protein K2L95_03785 [Alphaproteobacteria bacterium]|nr:hypothetical protein [Alphaproteobacteria bacterium]
MTPFWVASTVPSAAATALAPVTGPRYNHAPARPIPYAYTPMAHGSRHRYVFTDIVFWKMPWIYAG